MSRAAEKFAEINRRQRQSPLIGLGAVIIGLNAAGRIHVVGCEPRNVRKARYRNQTSDTLVHYVADVRLARRLAAAIRKSEPATPEYARRALVFAAAEMRINLVTTAQIQKVINDAREAKA